MNNQIERSTRFKKTIWIALGFIAALWGLLFAYFGHYSESDKAAYDRLVSGENDEEIELTETQVSRQRRENIEKSVFFNSGSQRLELKIAAKVSELALEKNDRRVEVVEHLQDVVCHLQESVNDGDAPQQTILVLKADKAIYHYKRGLFSAENVQLKRYLVPGKNLASADLVDSALIAEGTAKTVSFSLGGKNLDFLADNFKGTFVLTPQEGTVAIAADMMTFQSGLVSLSGNASVGYLLHTMDADQIVLHLLNKKIIQSIVANGDVRMNYEGFTAYSDQALFQRKEDGSRSVLQGTIILTCDSPQKQCRVVNREGDTILSNDIVVDTLKKEVVFAKPKGTLKSFGWTFKAKKMVWNHQGSHLTLSGNVKMISENSKLEANKDVRMVLASVNGKRTLRRIHADGEVVLTHFNLENATDQTLKSYGSLVIDHEKMEIKMQSRENGQQVFFEDAKGQIHADKAFVKYDYVGKKIVPKRIVLQGNAKIENRLEGTAGNKNKSYQYIVSDRVDFIPQTKEMIFKADKGKRVLFFDKENNLEVSAPGMKLIRDKAARKDTIQGLGDVRFNFVTGELEQLRRDFSFDKRNEATKK